jgi:hypothetical protein
MEYIAALIIACSNLTQPGYMREGSESVKTDKVACIKRVKECGAKHVADSTWKKLLNCADEVY